MVVSTLTSSSLSMKPEPSACSPPWGKGLHCLHHFRRTDRAFCSSVLSPPSLCPLALVPAAYPQQLVGYAVSYFDRSAPYSSPAPVYLRGPDRSATIAADKGLQPSTYLACVPSLMVIMLTKKQPLEAGALLLPIPFF